MENLSTDRRPYYSSNTRIHYSLPFLGTGRSLMSVVDVCPAGDTLTCHMTAVYFWHEWTFLCHKICPVPKIINSGRKSLHVVGTSIIRTELPEKPPSSQSQKTRVLPQCINLVPGQPLPPRRTPLTIKMWLYKMRQEGKSITTAAHWGRPFINPNLTISHLKMGSYQSLFSGNL